MKKSAQEIKTFDDYKILKYDKLNYELQVYTSVTNPRTKETNMKWKNYGFYGKLEDLLDSLINHKLLNGEESKTVKSIKRELEKIRNELLEKINLVL